MRSLVTCNPGTYISARLTTLVTEPELDEQGTAETDLGHALAHVDRSIESYISRCRARIPSFVESNFSLEHTWILQKRTLWRDLLCAPVNSAWALPYVAVLKTTEVMEKVGFLRPAQWARSLPSGIKTGYQSEIERLICANLLEWPQEHSAEGLPQGFLKELEVAPALKKLIEAPGFKKSDARGALTLRDLIRDFSSGRALVSDLSATFLTMATSWWTLGGMSRGLRGIAYSIAKTNAHDRAASRFFLGKKVGSAFYNVFPPAVQENQVRVIILLLGVGLTVGAMACTILSDPIRKTLGFHRNRLDVLLDGIEKELIVLCHKRISKLDRVPGGERGGTWDACESRWEG